jgi:hypothetical protein
MEIREQICMGSGDYSYAMVGRLYTQLGRAIEILNGIQQVPPVTTPQDRWKEWEQQVEDGEIEIEQIAYEIFVGLTGKKPKRES